MSYVELFFLYGFIVIDLKFYFFVDCKYLGLKLCRFGILGYCIENLSILFILIDVREVIKFFLIFVVI